MLAARSVHLWSPGKDIGPETGTRAEMIVRSREELLRLLADFPKPEHELSFTDLVEQVCEDNQSKGDGWDEETAKEAAKSIVETIRRSSKRAKRSNSGATGFHGGGVFLNVYLPPSVRESLTSSRARRSSLERTPSFTKRERASPTRMECSKHGCWPSIWTKGKLKPKKQLV